MIAEAVVPKPMRTRANMNMPTFWAAVCTTTAMTVSTAAQKRDGRRPMASVTAPHMKPAMQPPRYSVEVFRAVVVVLRLKY